MIIALLTRTRRSIILVVFHISDRDVRTPRAFPLAERTKDDFYVRVSITEAEASPILISFALQEKYSG